MSASLVGSEMCIRDRSVSAPPSSPACSSSPSSPPRLRHPLLGGLRQAPVSYTHLTLPTICSV
eukprot:1088377-Alexandrium_andersonii.AAC.1